MDSEVGFRSVSHSSAAVITIFQTPEYPQSLQCDQRSAIPTRSYTPPLKLDTTLLLLLLRKLKPASRAAAIRSASWCHVTSTLLLLLKTVSEEQKEEEEEEAKSENRNLNGQRMELVYFCRGRGRARAVSFLVFDSFL